MSNPTSVPGHVFVIHGKLQDVTCDAVLIPTDTSFTVEKQWWDVVGPNRHPQRPERWAGLGYGNDAADDRFWYIDVTDDDLPTAGEQLISRVSNAVKQIGASLRSNPVTRGRARRLITMPLLGAGSGGLDAARAVRLLLDGLQKIADQNDVDLAIVVLGRDRFEALQRRRREIPGQGNSQHAERARALGELAQERGLSLMIGAGVSMGAGLPDWAGLLESLSKMVTDRAVVDSEAFKSLPVLDQAELLARLLKENFHQSVAAVVRGDASTPRLPALGHFLLAGLRCPQVATTNYDQLYESAVGSQADSNPIVALPYERPKPTHPWILKMHGDAEREEEDLVLSRSSFVAYDARRRAAGSVFQTMLMTSHVLFVGVSLTDDNVLRLTHEVTGLVKGQQLGTALDLGTNLAKKTLWKDTLRWIDLNSPPGLPAGEQPRELAWQVRELEVFLDTVALWSVPERKTQAVELSEAH